MAFHGRAREQLLHARVAMTIVKSFMTLVPRKKPFAVRS